MPRLAVLVATVGLLLAIAGAWTAPRAQQGALPALTDVIRADRGRG